jgi:hypothetical protein
MLFIRWSEEKAVEAYNLRLAGMTAQQIANSWGVTRNAIIGLTWRARKQLGLPPLPTRAPTPPKPKKDKPPKAVVLWKTRKAQLVALDRLPDAPEPLMVLFMDLQLHHCRWPEGLGRGMYSTYCGHQKREGSAYCDHHHWRSTHDIRR